MPGSLTRLEVDTTGSSINFDYAGTSDRIFNGSNAIDEEKDWGFLNDGNALKFVFLFTISGAFAQTLPPNTIMNSGLWDSDTKKWTPFADFGNYKATAEFDGTNWWVDISQSIYI